MDSAIYRINSYSETKQTTATHWTVIYPVDSVTQPLNSPDLGGERHCESKVPYPTTGLKPRPLNPRTSAQTMGHHELVLLLLLFFLGLSRGSPPGLAVVNFKLDMFSFLNITNLGSDLVADNIDCGFTCLEIPSCFSYNVAAYPDINGKFLCEPLPSDKFNNSDKFTHSPLYHHFSIPVSTN